MRKVQFLAVGFTLALAVPFTVAALARSRLADQSYVRDWQLR